MNTHERYVNDFPLLAPEDAHWTERVVTQGHADYCKANGHAEPVDSPYCPRCGTKRD